MEIKTRSFKEILNHIFKKTIIEPWIKYLRYKIQKKTKKPTNFFKNKNESSWLIWQIFFSIGIKLIRIIGFIIRALILHRKYIVPLLFMKWQKYYKLYWKIFFRILFVIMLFSLPILVHQGFGVLGEYFFLIQPLFTIPFFTIDNVLNFPYLNPFLLKESIFFNLQSNKIFLVFIFSSLLTSILLFLTAFFSLNQLPDSEKSSDYECGFEPFDNATRQPFSVDFFLIALIFLVFDLEIILFIPFILEIDELPIHAFYNFSIIFIILLFSFCYEWRRGILDWSLKEPKVLQKKNI